MKDWEENIIKNGDTIVEIRTSPLFNEAQMMMLHNGKATPIGPTIKMPERLWEVVSEHLVTEINNTLYAEREYEGKTKFTVHFKLIEHPMNNIICIKGVSDNENDYYLTHHK